MPGYSERAGGDTVSLVIGKSLGWLAASVTPGRGLPAVWLTPILTNEPTAAALRRAAAPRLPIGGTADKVCDGRLARSLTPHVLEIDRPDHGMFVPGHPSESAAVLGQVTTTAENSPDQQVWPPGTGQGNS